MVVRNCCTRSAQTLFPPVCDASERLSQGGRPAEEHSFSKGVALHDLEHRLVCVRIRFFYRNNEYLTNISSFLFEC